MYYLAQCFGVIAILSSLVIYQQKTRKRILLFKLLQDACWFSHYMILGTYSAAATSFLCMSRSVVYYHNDKRFFRSRAWLPIYIALYALSAVLTWNGVFSVFPAVSSILSTVGFWQKEPHRTKLIAILASLCTLVYNITVAGSVAVYVGVTFTVTSSLVSLVRYAREKKRSAQTEKGEADRP